jgi:hypothetical protein
MSTLLNIEEKNNEQLEKEEETKSEGKSGSDYEEEYKKYQKTQEMEEEKNKPNELRYKGILIKDSDEKMKKKKFIRKILCKDGQFRIEIGKSKNNLDDNKKCHCCSGKKYRVCCKNDDIPGDFDDKNEEFYCDIEQFIIFYSMIPEETDNSKKDKKEAEDNQIKDEVAVIEKKFGTIFI